MVTHREVLVQGSEHDGIKLEILCLAESRDNKLDQPAARICKCIVRLIYASSMALLGRPAWLVTRPGWCLYDRGTNITSHKSDARAVRGNRETCQMEIGGEINQGLVSEILAKS